MLARIPPLAILQAHLHLPRFTVTPAYPYPEAGRPLLTSNARPRCAFTPPAQDGELGAVDCVRQYPILPNISVFRCQAKGRLKYEVEYGRKRGSCDNSYLIRMASHR